MLTKAEKEKLRELIHRAMDAENDLGACEAAGSQEEIDMYVYRNNTAQTNLWEFIDKEL